MFSFWKKKPKDPKDMNREELIALAKENAAAAREQIGDETLDKIREAMMKKENSPLEQAKRQVKSMETEDVRVELRHWMKEGKD